MIEIPFEKIYDSVESCFMTCDTDETIEIGVPWSGMKYSVGYYVGTQNCPPYNIGIALYKNDDMYRSFEIGDYAETVAEILQGEHDYIKDIAEDIVADVNLPF